MSDFESSNFDSTEREAKDRFKNEQLKERLDELMKENTTLRTQFEEAVNLTEQMEAIHQENANLLAENRRLKAENDDLALNLRILKDRNQEASNKLKNEKNISSTQRGSDLNSMNKEIEKIKSQTKAQIDEIYGQLDQANQEREREELEKKMLMRKMDVVINEAGRYFESSFQTIDDVLSAFKQPRSQNVSQNTTTLGQSTLAPQSRSILPQQSSMVQQQGDLQNLQKKVKRLKKQIAEKEDLLSAKEEEVVRMNRDHDREKKQWEQQQAELANELNIVNAQAQRDQETYSHNISQFEAKIQALKSEMDKEKKKCKKANDERKALKKQVHSLQYQAGLPQTHQAQATDLSDSDSGSNTDSNLHYNHGASRQSAPRVDPRDETIDKLTTSQAELTEQLKSANQKKDQLAKILAQRDQAVHALQIDNEKARNDLNALNTVYKETLNEVDTLRSALTARKEAEKQIKEAEPKEKEANPRVTKLQKALEAQKQKYYQLQVASDKKDTLIQQLQLDQKHLQQQIKEAEEAAERAQNETKELNTTIQATPKPKADDFIPPSAFRCSEFPTELSSKVAKIANNPSLQPASKIQNTYKVIRKFYMNQVTMRDNALDEAFTENQTISNAVNQFLVDASLAIDIEEPITFKDFFAQNSGKFLVDKISQVRSENADLAHENEQMKATLQQLRDTFADCGDGSVQDPQTHIIQIRERLNQTQGELQSTHKKMKSYKSQLKKCEQQAKKNEQTLKQTIDDLKAENETLSQHQETATKQLQDLKQENQRLTVELSDVTHTRDDLESTIIQDHDEQVQQATAQLEDQVSSLKKQLRSQKTAYDQLESDYRDAQDDLNRSRTQLQTLKSQKAQRDAEFAELRKQLEENERAAQERLEREKESLTESFNETVAKLHEQCEKHREDVKHINDQLAEQQILVANQKAQISKITKEKLKAINEMTQMKDQMKRDQKLMEQTIRTNKAQAESQYSAMLENYKQKIDSEKKNIYAYGLDAFREYFNPGSAIDERSYKSVIDKARERINQLQASDSKIRNMVGASNNQTTEDAIAQMIL